MPLICYAVISLITSGQDWIALFFNIFLEINVLDVKMSDTGVIDKASKGKEPGFTSQPGCCLVG